MLPLDGSIPEYCWQSFFLLSFAFQSLSTMHFFQPYPLCDNMMFQFVSFQVSKYIDTLANKPLLTNMTSLQKLQLCTPCHLWLSYDSESKLYIKPWKSNPSIRQLQNYYPIYPFLSFLAQNYYSLLLKTSAEKLSSVCNPLSIKKGQ